MKEKNLLANEKTTEQRLGICNRCEHYVHMIKLCKKCGCIMPLKTKIQSANCPLKKW